MTKRRPARGGGFGPHRRSWRAARVPAFATSLVCAISTLFCFAGPPAESTASPTALTTGFYESDIVGGPSGRNCAPTAAPTATPDTSLDSLFDDRPGPGWVAGDIAYSTALPNGQESFVFGDSLFGTAQSDGVASLTGFGHGSELVGAMSDLKTDVGGTYSSPEPLVPDVAPATWQAGATYMENGDQLIIVNEFDPVAGSLFSTFTGRAGIAVMSLASGKPVFSSVTPLPTDPVTQWGTAMTQSGGDDYVYGGSFNTNTDVWYGMKLARVPVGSSLDTSKWTYWNGSGWLPGESNAVAEPFPLINGVIPLHDGTGFMGVGVGGTYGKSMQVSLTFACSPTGPWSSPRNIYSIPEIWEYPNELAYMATFHPEISAGGTLVTSYSVDSLDGLSALEQNDHQYQPHFIEIASGFNPPVSAPEVPAPLLLPFAALAVGLIGYGINRRSNRRRNVAVR